VADTNELQSDDVPTLIANLDTVVDRVETDTQDLQTQIGTAGAGLTNMPWNASWDTEVQSECTDALNAYDPPTKTELDSGFSALNNVSTAQVNTEVDNAIVTYGLDHLVAVADADDVVDNSVMAKIASLTGDWSTFDPQVESLEALEHRIGNIASTGAAFHAAAESATVADSGVETNTYASTEHRDGVLHSVAEGSTDVDVYYQFDVGSAGLAVEVEWTAYLQGNNDTMVVQAWDWIGEDWEVIANIVGTAGATAETDIEALFSKHTGTGGNVGKVRIRFFNQSQSSEIFVDQIFIAYAEALSGNIALILADTADIQPNYATEAKQDIAQSDLDKITGSDGATLATSQGNYAPAKAGDSMDVDSVNSVTITGDGSGTPFGV
jgi:hypothetical protein